MKVTNYSKVSRKTRTNIICSNFQIEVSHSLQLNQAIEMLKLARSESVENRHNFERTSLKRGKAFGTDILFSFLP